MFETAPLLVDFLVLGRRNDTVLWGRFLFCPIPAVIWHEEPTVSSEEVVGTRMDFERVRRDRRTAVKEPKELLESLSLPLELSDCFLLELLLEKDK